MVDAIKTFFMAIGIFTVGFMIYIVACNTIRKFNRWRKNGCKIKCLCKPHVYRIYCYWSNSGEGELILKCSKCGKCKKIYVDTESFENWRRRQEE